MLIVWFKKENLIASLCVTVYCQEGGSDTEIQNEDQAIDTLDDEDYAATASDTLDEAVDTLDEEDLAVDTHRVRSLHEEEQCSGWF